MRPARLVFGVLGASVPLTVFLFLSRLASVVNADPEPTCEQMIRDFDYTDPNRHAWVEAHKDKVLACMDTMTCGQMMAEMAKRQMKEVAICAKELNYNTPAEKKAKLYCTFKCVMKKAKLLTADGRIDEHFVADMMQRYTAMTPPRFQPMVARSEEMFKACKDEHESKFDDSEETCASYGPLIQCMMGMMTLCDEATK